ncbi:MAG: 23S rRNA (uracil(1939)-C(5))-methyltransferase RlmD [Acidiferrobacterales bacterium]
MTTAPPQPSAAATETATVEELDYDGRGVAHIDGKAVFIEGALPGERVRFRYGRRRKRYDLGYVVEVLASSPERIATPQCSYFGTCGGCSLQHLSPDAQVAAKERVLRDNLLHIGKVEPEHWLSPLRGPVWGYRRKARLGVRLVPKKGGILVGFRERRRSFITPLADCKTLDPRFARLLPQLAQLVARLSCPERVPQIEVAAGDKAAALVFRHLTALSTSDLEQLRAFGETHAIQIYLQPRGPESVHALWPTNPPLLAYQIPEHDIEIQFGPIDFTQVNTAVNGLMVTRALALLEPQSGDTVVDLFCGLGNFTLPLARRVARVIGVEGDPTLVQRAKHNAAVNRISNAAFHCIDLYSDVPAIAWDDIHGDKVLLDPPRSGAIEVIKQFPAHRPARIVYVSCYPATLARDSEYLVHALGYRLVSAGAADMFPQTSHMECIALFVRD